MTAAYQTLRFQIIDIYKKRAKKTSQVHQVHEEARQKELEQRISPDFHP
jgi:hypothetical protein